MSESEKREHTLKEWEHELNKDLLFLENIIGKEDVKINDSEFNTQLVQRVKSFFREGDIQGGYEIIEKIKHINTDEYTTKVFLNIIRQLIKVVMITAPLRELGLEAIEYLPFFLDKNSQSVKKKELFDSIYGKYLSLMPKFKQSIANPDNSQVIIDKISDMLSGKLDEINIKIEENQRALHQLAMLSSSSLRNELSHTKGETSPVYEPSGNDNSELFYICRIGTGKVALSAEQVLNIYKVSPQKAIKMAKKSFIRFSQLGGFFSSITKGLKKELKDRSKEELDNIFLLVLNPLLDMDEKYDFRKAIMVKLPDKNRFGVVFVKDLYKSTPVHGNIIRGLVETRYGDYPFFDIGEIWRKNELMEI